MVIKINWLKEPSVPIAMQYMKIFVMVLNGPTPRIRLTFTAMCIAWITSLTNKSVLVIPARRMLELLCNQRLVVTAKMTKELNRIAHADRSYWNLKNESVDGFCQKNFSLSYAWHKRNIKWKGVRHFRIETQNSLFRHPRNRIVPLLKKKVVLSCYRRWRLALF